MTKIIKVRLELANDGSEYNNGSIISAKTKFVTTLSLDAAKKAFLEGKEVHFIYKPDSNINEPWIKICDDVDYLTDHYAYGDTCGIVLNKHMLSDDEYVLVNKLAGLSGMACWFMLMATGNEYEVHDLEDNVDMSLVKGLKILFEGISSLDDYSCSNDEKDTCRSLCERLNIKFTV